MPPSSGRRGRLSRSADFERVYRRGRSRANRLLVVHVFPRGDQAPVRLGLSVSRKVGGAVERNRVKRVLREAFAARSDALPPGHDVVVVARADAREVAERDGLAGLQAPFDQLLVGVGLLAGAEPR